MSSNISINMKRLIILCTVQEDRTRMDQYMLYVFQFKKIKKIRNFPNMRILKINSVFYCNEFPSIEVVQVNANGCDTRDSHLQLKIVSVSFPLKVYHLPNNTSPDSFIFVNPCELHSCIMCQIPFHLVCLYKCCTIPFYSSLSRLCKPLHIFKSQPQCPFFLEAFLGLGFFFVVVTSLSPY